jgi:hypothetical protein
VGRPGSSQVIVITFKSTLYWIVFGLRSRFFRVKWRLYDTLGYKKYLALKAIQLLSYTKQLANSRLTECLLTYIRKP